MKHQWTSAYKTNPAELDVYECYTESDGKVREYRWNGTAYRKGWRSLENEHPAPFPEGPNDKWRPINYGMAA